MHRRLHKLDAYVERAKHIAALLHDIENLVCFPAVPQVNMFHIHIANGMQALTDRRDRIAVEQSVWLSSRFYDSYLPEYTASNIEAGYMELHVGDVLLEMPDEKITSLFQQLAARS